MYGKYQQENKTSCLQLPLNRCTRIVPDAVARKIQDCKGGNKGCEETEETEDARWKEVTSS
jgi:hypothetical protein